MRENYQKNPEIVSYLSDCNDCGHCAEMYTPSNGDPIEVVIARARALQTITEWLAAAPSATVISN